MTEKNGMRLYRVNYEEYLHFEEFIEAASPEEAQRIFRNSIQDIEPVDTEVYDFDVEPAEGGDSEDLDNKEVDDTRLRHIESIMSEYGASD